MIRVIGWAIFYSKNGIINLFAQIWLYNSGLQSLHGIMIVNQFKKKDIYHLVPFQSADDKNRRHLAVKTR